MFGLFNFWKKHNQKAFRIFSSEEETIASLPLNQGVQVLVENASVCLIRTENGIHALEDRCPHQGAPIHRGKCKKDGVVTCPYHGLSISLTTGKLLEEKIGDPAKIYTVEFSSKGLVIWV